MRNCTVDTAAAVAALRAAGLLSSIPETSKLLLIFFDEKGRMAMEFEDAIG